MPRISGRAPGLLFVIPLTALALVSCSNGQPTSQAVFRVQQGVQPNAASQLCQLHQTQPPTSAYRGGPDSVTKLELPFLAYYTANGNKHYCDGKPPTATDKNWAQLYVQLTGNPAAVQQILSS